MDNWDKDENVINKLIKTIESTLQDESFQVSTEDFDNNVREIASFVNPDEQEWFNKSILYEAFWDSYKFVPKIPFSVNVKYGLKTSNFPLNIDPIMVYQTCLKYGIITSRESSVKDLEDEISLLCFKLTPFRENIFSIIARCTRRGLIGIKNHLSSPKKKSGMDIKYIYNPTTPGEAIKRAAQEYRWDISSACNPIEEYKEMDKCGSHGESYVPADKNWIKIFNLNREYFHLDSRFMQKFSSLYNENIRSALYYRNGDSFESDYFVLGVHPSYYEKATKKGLKINLDASGLLTDMYTTLLCEEVPSDPVVRNREIISSPDFICTRQELSNYWKITETFVSPHNPSKEFSQHNLKMIIRNSEADDEIIKTINEISALRIKLVDSCFFNLLRYGREESVTLLKKIMTLGFTMRGYKICYEDFPLTESSYDLQKYQDVIETSVSEKIFSLVETYEEILNEIPLMTGRNENCDDKNFHINTYGEKKTIGQVLKTVQNGNDINSCIRTNSNYLLITSWYFLNKFKEKSFDISHLKFIF